MSGVSNGGEGRSTPSGPQRLEPDGVALIQSEDGTIILELHDCGWGVEVTLYTDFSTECYIKPVCDKSIWCKSHKHIVGCLKDQLGPDAEIEFPDDE